MTNDKSTSILSDDQKEKQPLLEQFGIVIVPKDINFNAYHELTWALKIGRHLHPSKVLELQCTGYGGEVLFGLAIVNLIQNDGNIKGIALGSSVSTHSFIWASCADRRIYKTATIGIHEIAAVDYVRQNESFSGWIRTERKEYELKVRDFQASNEIIANLYVKASNKNKRWWLSKLSEGANTPIYISAKELVGDLGMARYV